MADRELYPVLLAEDNLDDLALIERSVVIANLPLVLYRVEHGEAAVSYLQGEGIFADRDRYPIPKLVFTNVKMPRMDGLELLVWIKQHPQWRHLPVVVFSTSQQPENMARCTDMGAASFFVKPADLHELVAILKQIMSLLPPEVLES